MVVRLRLNYDCKLPKRPVIIINSAQVGLAVLDKRFKRLLGLRPS